MRSPIASLLLVMACTGASFDAAAEWRCDCTQIVDGCSADVSIGDTFVQVSTPAAQCARVDYLIDGMPFVSVAVDGSAREHWIARGDDPRVLVQSCQVCADNAARQAPEAPAELSGSASAGPLVPVIAPEPTYPPQAQRQGLEGTVTVNFVVTPSGETQDVRVAASQPPGVFDLAATSAISRWRYRADSTRETVALTETVEFSLNDLLFNEIPTSATRTGTDAAHGSDNQCIRETASYNFGEMVEIGLISACSQPLSVFACAVGTGALAQRWVCTSTEQNGTVLVRQGDSRRGQSTLVDTASGQRQFEYAENFFVVRAPNTEYWWMVCARDDERCATLARQWTDSLNRQAAHIDPQLLAKRDVSRSY